MKSDVETLSPTRVKLTVDLPFDEIQPHLDAAELSELFDLGYHFKAVDAVSKAEGDRCHAQSGAHLRELLRGNHRYVFTLVHKFQTAEVLTDRTDVIVLTDEAHRSQYDTLALNMRAAMPKATFLAFTGTPLIAGEERTRDVFGDYVSIYDFQQSVEDGATVPLFYENRTPELQLVNPDLNEDLRILGTVPLTWWYKYSANPRIASVLDRPLPYIASTESRST